MVYGHGPLEVPAYDRREGSLTVTTATMTNLLTYGGFENAGWSGNGSYDTTHVKYGTYARKMVGTSSTGEVLTYHSGGAKLVKGHIYYARYEVYHESDAGSASCGVYFPEAEPALFEGHSIGASGQWNLVSGRSVRSSWSDNSAATFRIDYNNTNSTVPLWVDGAVLVDLTTDFGSGSEPSKAWCDANIGFFSGSTTVATSHTITYYDNGKVSTATVSYDAVVSLPTGRDGTRTFAGWWTGSETITSYTATADITLIARYDTKSYATSISLIGLQPNPADVGATLLVTVGASSTETEVPRWGSMSLAFADGLPMSSPYQVGIWDTSEPDDWATFEGDGIATSGTIVPPLSATTVPLPRVGAWSSGISSASKAVSWTITGTADKDYTSRIVVRSPEGCCITAADIAYTASSGTVTTASATGSNGTIKFPSGTYKSFKITVTAISQAYHHVRVLDVAPGGA